MSDVKCPLIHLNRRLEIDKEVDGGQHIRHIEISNEWTTWRDNLAQEIFNQFRDA